MAAAPQFLLSAPRLLALGLLLVLAGLLAFFSLPARAEKARKPPPPLPAAQYPLHETHAAEHVTVAAVPGNTAATAPNTRLDYGRYELLPLRVVVTNDSDAALNLDDARILFIGADNSTANAATDDELQRRLFTLKSATGSTVPLPLPIPIPIRHGKDNVDKKISEDVRDFGFPTTTVAPHTTVAGWLFYDIRGLDTPVLAHATLEVRRLRLAATNAPLDTFDVPLSPSRQGSGTPANSEGEAPATATPQ